MFIPQSKNQIQKGIYKTAIPGLYYLQRKIVKDNRGFFSEITYTHQLEKLIQKPFIVKQINHSLSQKNVIRGLHAEDWKKLIIVTSGVCFSALADIRPDSPTFGQIETFKLGFQKDALTGSLFISEGIANSICVLQAPVSYLYCVDRLYSDRDPQGDQSISLFDPDLNISWPIDKKQMIISDRDKKAVTLKQLYPQKFKS